jgi:hypothetical protein
VLIMTEAAGRRPTGREAVAAACQVHATAAWLIWALPGRS